MVLQKRYFPKTPVIVGAISALFFLIVAGGDHGPWVSSPLAFVFPTCIFLWGIPLVIGATMGGIIGVVTDVILRKFNVTNVAYEEFFSSILTLIVLGFLIFGLLP